MSKDKTNKEYDFLVPHVGGDGNVPFHCPAKDKTEERGRPIVWKANKSFKVGLEFVNMYSSQSSTNIFAVMRNAATDAKYKMREDDFKKLLKNTPAIAGIFVGEWRFRKKGRYISICEA